MVPITDGAGRGSRVAIIVVNYRTPDLALACLDAVTRERDTLPDLTLILVDGGSDDGSAERLAAGLAERGHPSWVEIMPLPINGGFGYANNQALLRLAARDRAPDYACLLNPDARPLPGALARLRALLDDQPRAAAAGAQLQDADGGLQGSAFTFTSARGEFSRGANTDIVRRLLGCPPIALACSRAARTPWVTGAAVMIRMTALGDVGLFDEGFFLYFEEVELMHRLTHAGWQIWHDPDARVEHIGGTATDIKWDEAGFHKPTPLPAYWYRSRRRYLVRTGGIAFAVLATSLFVLGRILWLVRCVVQGRPDRFPRRTSRDMIRHSFWPSATDRAGVRLPRLGDDSGGIPLWMRR